MLRKQAALRFTIYRFRLSEYSTKRVALNKQSAEEGNDLRAQRDFLDKFAKENGLRAPEDWKTVTTKHIKDAGGRRILDQHPSLFSMLQTVYPDRKWNVFTSLSKLPRGFWKKPDNQRLFLSHLAEKLKIHSPSDWRQVTEKILKKEGGSSLLAYYPNVFSALSSLYPETEWNLFTTRKRLPNDFWTSLNNQHHFLSYLATQKKYSKLEDWYNITVQDIKQHGGAQLLQIYPSVADIFTTLFNDYPWDVSKFNRAPTGFWESLENQRKWIQQLGDKLGVKELSDWQQYSANTIIEHGGRCLLVQHNNYMEMLATLFPKHSWNFLHQKRVSKTFFDSPDNTRTYLTQLLDSTGLKVEELTENHLRTTGGFALLDRFPSIPRMFASTFPEKDWTYLLNDSSRRDYWRSHENQKRFFQSFEKFANIRSFYQWKNVKISSFIQRGGAHLLREYGSLLNALSACYPNIDFDFMNKSLADAYWAKESRQKMFIDEICNFYDISLLDEWHSLTPDRIKQLGGNFLLDSYGSVYSALCYLYPKGNWDVLKATSLPDEFYAKVSNQRDLLNRIAETLNLHSTHDWLALTKSKLIEMRSGKLLKYYSTIPEMLQAVFPNRNWICSPELIEDTEVNIIETNENTIRDITTEDSDPTTQYETDRKRLELLAASFNIATPSDWQHITMKQFKDHKLHDIIRRYGNICATIIKLFPDENFDLTNFHRIPQSFFDDFENQRTFISHLENKLDVKQDEDWIRVSESQVKEFSGGRTLLARYESIYHLLAAIYPEKDWSIFSKQSGINSSYWNVLENQRTEMDRIAKHLKISSPFDWTGITQNRFQQEHGASEILRRYSTLRKALAAIYPEEEWKFTNTKRNISDSYWDSIQNQKDFLEHIKVKLSVHEMTDWYNITPQMLRESGATNLLNLYSSLYDMLQSIYPKFKWNPLLFVKAPKDVDLTIEQQREWMDSLCAKLNFPDFSSFQSLTVTQFIKYGGNIVLKQHDTYCDMLQRIYPEHEWKISKFPRIPRNYFDKISNQRIFLDQISESLQIESNEDWLDVYQSQIRANGGNSLLARYESIYDMLVCVYPESDWDCFSKQSNSCPAYWNKVENQRKHFDAIADSLAVSAPSDWKHITTQQFMEQYGGQEILRRYSSMFEALQSIYPEKTWKLCEVQAKIPVTYWESTQNQRDFFDSIGEKLEITKLDDWYKIPANLVRNHGGANLLATQGKFHEIIQRVYPEHDWDVGKFSNSKKTEEMHFLFLEQFEKENGISRPDGWSKVTKEQFINSNGGRILSAYNNMYHMLSQNFPEENWNILELRKNIPTEYWDDDGIRKWVEIFEEEHMIKNPSDWYRISRNLVQQAKGSGIIAKFGTLPNFLRYLHPDYEWNFNTRHYRHKRATQRRLFVFVKRLFPGEEVIEEFQHDELSRASGKPIELDIFLPERNLALEYHGKHHYEELAAWCNIEMQQARDNEKLQLCKALNIKLIIIPYWWDESKNSLQERLIQEDIALPNTKE